MEKQIYGWTERQSAPGMYVKVLNVMIDEKGITKWSIRDQFGVWHSVSLTPEEAGQLLVDVEAKVKETRA